MKTLKETLQDLYNNSKNLEAFISMSEPLKRKINKKLIYPNMSENMFEIIRREIIHEDKSREKEINGEIYYYKTSDKEPFKDFYS